MWVRLFQPPNPHWGGSARSTSVPLRAAYRTGGALRFYGAIRRAHWDTLTGARRQRGRRQHFRYARYGTRDMDRCAANG